jgi:GntR family transcriptional regulator
MNQIKDSILRGEVSSGEAVPSIRELARELRISVITTKRAYDDLEKEGFLTSVAGKGFFVTSQNKEILNETKLRTVEEKLMDAINTANLLGITKKELEEIFQLLIKEE